MAEVPYRCSTCGAPADAWVHQHAGTRLQWGLSVRCLRCGNAFEMDDSGLPDAPWRQALLDQNGTWGLIPRSSDRWRSPAVLAALRQALPLDLAGVARLKREPGPVVMRGTRD